MLKVLDTITVAQVTADDPASVVVVASILSRNEVLGRFICSVDEPGQGVIVKFPIERVGYIDGKPIVHSADIEPALYGRD